MPEDESDSDEIPLHPHRPQDTRRRRTNITQHELESATYSKPLVQKTVRPAHLAYRLTIYLRTQGHRDILPNKRHRRLSTTEDGSTNGTKRSRHEQELLWQGVRRRTEFNSTPAHAPVLAHARLLVQAMVMTGHFNPSYRLSPWPERQKSGLNALIIDAWRKAGSNDRGRMFDDVRPLPEPKEARRASL